MPSTTAQSIFNTAYTGMLAQNQRSQIGNDRCAYRGPNGLKCAVGMVLTNDEYNPLMNSESMDVAELLDRGLLPDRLVPHLKLLDDLQIAHDCDHPRHWPTELAKIASKHKLEVPCSGD